MTCTILTYLYPEHADLFKVGYVSSLATKLSDTCGSEIGKAYGKTTLSVPELLYLILHVNNTYTIIYTQARHTAKPRT